MHQQKNQQMNHYNLFIDLFFFVFLNFLFRDHIYVRCKDIFWWLTFKNLHYVRVLVIFLFCFWFFFFMFSYSEITENVGFGWQRFRLPLSVRVQCVRACVCVLDVVIY